MTANQVTGRGEASRELAGDPADATEGRRDARKRRTRAALHACATRLTRERGFHDATIADIATCAGVSPRTFFAYFPTKEAALFAPLDDLIGSLERALATPPTTPDALLTVRDWLANEVFTGGALEAVTSADFRQLALDETAVAAYGLQFVDRVTTALTHALRTQWDAPDDDPLPGSVAAAVVAASMCQMPTGSHAVAPVPTVDVERMLADVDRTIAFVRAGLVGLDAPASSPAG